MMSFPITCSADFSEHASAKDQPSLERGQAIFEFIRSNPSATLHELQVTKTNDNLDAVIDLGDTQDPETRYVRIDALGLRDMILYMGENRPEATIAHTRIKEKTERLTDPANDMIRPHSTYVSAQR
jgi:hypothetical protein